MSLRKHQTRTTDGHKKNEAEFRSEMDNIFGVAHANSEKMVYERED